MRICSADRALYGLRFSPPNSPKAADLLDGPEVGATGFAIGRGRADGDENDFGDGGCEIRTNAVARGMRFPAAGNGVEV